MGKVIELGSSNLYFVSGSNRLGRFWLVDGQYKGISYSVDPEW